MHTEPRPVPRSALAALLIVSLGLSSCKTMETYLPELIAIGGTVLEVAALSYKEGQYAGQVSLLMATLTPAATAMAATWAENRRRKQELERLQALEAEIEAEYAALDESQAGGATDPGTSWGTAQDSGGDGWTNVAPTVGSSDAAGEPSPWGSAYAEWGDAYTAKGVAPRSAASAPLELDVALLKREGGGAVAIDNGAVLHDAASAPGGKGDELRVFFSPSRDAYVYVIAIDARARVQPLFPPRLPPAAPVPAGTRCSCRASRAGTASTTSAAPSTSISMPARRACPISRP